MTVFWMCSGHGAMKENYFLDDGAYSALQIIVETAKQKVEGGKSITDDLLSKLPEPLEASEFRMKLKVRPDASACMSMTAASKECLLAPVSNSVRQGFGSTTSSMVAN